MKNYHNTWRNNIQKKKSVSINLKSCFRCTLNYFLGAPCLLCAIKNPETPKKYYFQNIYAHKNSKHPLPQGLPQIFCPDCQLPISDGSEAPNWIEHLESGKCKYRAVCQFCEEFLKAETLTNKWTIKKMHDRGQIKLHYE